MIFDYWYFIEILLIVFHVYIDNIIKISLIDGYYWKLLKFIENYYKGI